MTRKEKERIIRQAVGCSELLLQLAEECAELCQAALKYRLVLADVDSAPVVEEEGLANLKEEAADVSLLLDILFSEEAKAEIEKRENFKLDRWIGRIK